MTENNYQLSAYLKGNAPISIALAFDYIAIVTKDSNLSEDCFELIHRETEYLNRQLDINKIQCYILAVLLSNPHYTTYLGLSDHAKISAIFMMSLQPDIDYLIKRGLMIRSHDGNGNGWTHAYQATTKLLDAVRYNTLPF